MKIRINPTQWLNTQFWNKRELVSNTAYKVVRGRPLASLTVLAFIFSKVEGINLLIGLLVF